MNCPICGAPMQRGHITGKSILRVVPDNGEKKNTRRLQDDHLTETYEALQLPGYPLDTSYAGLAPWVIAEYCLPCKKVYAQLDILDFGKEELA